MEQPTGLSTLLPMQACTLAAVFAAAVATAAPTKPNVLFVVADDLGWDDVGFRSHQINTPIIDGLAAGGVVLDQYYVQCVCSPSRAVFQTGRYPVHNTIYDWIHPDATYGLPLNETTLGDKFHDAGYATHAVGKWYGFLHLGFFKEEYTPTFRGYESFYGFYTGGEDYYTHQSSGAYDFRRDPSWQCGKNCSQVAEDALDGYSTTLFANEAVNIVKAHDTSRPLFLYLAFQAVHSPPQVPQQYVSPYNNTIANHERRVFAGMLSALDEGFGNVTAALKARGMLDNTLIIFTTDNGGPTTTGDGVGSRNWPLRGGKHTIWEGGTRGTALLNGPMLKTTGYEYRGMMHAADWLPTLVTAAGLSPGGTLPLDGVDQWHAINTNGTSPRDSFFYGNNDDNTPESWGIREGKWKLLQFGGGSPSTWYPPVNASVAVVGADTSVAGTCATRTTAAYPGNDLGHVSAATAGDCCSACLAESACAAWTWQSQQVCPDVEPTTGAAGAVGCCYLKHNVTAGDEKYDVNATSGSGSSPLPASSFWQLYDVDGDPTEHHDVSAANPDVVAKLKADLLDVVNNRVPLIPDADCPPVVHPVDPKVGKVWGPWC